jgi:hypothetical protein
MELLQHDRKYLQGESGVFKSETLIYPLLPGSSVGFFEGYHAIYELDILIHYF